MHFHRLLTYLRFALLGFGLSLGLPAQARDFMLTDATIGQYVPPGLQAGPKDPFLPVWPVLKDGEAVGYLFETDQLVSFPGFTGTPIDMAVALDAEGKFLDVRLLDQNEPVFTDGLGPQPLFEFLKQYRGKSVRDSIKIADAHAEGEKQDSANTYLDGVTKATASVRIVNQTILASALKVARAKLAGIAPASPARLKDLPFRPQSWQQLLDAGLIAHLRLTGREVEAAFAGTRFAGQGEERPASPDDAFVDLYVAPLDLPLVARNLFAAPGLDLLANRLSGDPQVALAVMSRGPWSFTGPDFVPGTPPDRLQLRQGAFPMIMRDTVTDLAPLPGLPKFDEIRVFKIDPRLGFDQAQPWTLALHVVRRLGVFYPESASHDFLLNFSLPDSVLDRPPPPPPAWLVSWRERGGMLAGLGVFLTTLTGLLILQRRLVRAPRSLAWIRRAMLALTLVFVGWYAQGQLSIVALLAVVKALRTGSSLAFFLFDPISAMLWAYVGATLLVWGRGTFCGWLCPFGAFQEFVADLGRLLRLPQLRLSPVLARRLPLLRYAVLAVLVGGTILAPALAETLAEAEPFKTAITLGFIRSWPFVLYAGAALAASLMVFKGYCRFLCPLGGALSLLSRLRRWDWIPRRQDCGSPCQLCAQRCRYRAIDRQGRIAYHECFQCLDCVAIHDSPGTCVPLVIQARRAARQAAAPSIPARAVSPHPHPVAEPSHES